ncbi:MAG: sigma-70 family RNA polymerase sigma factor [Calditrichaceae bacterium]|nr:sigma-70 family RNA polymerase sigma factor [Calditrichaceae bacterium]MBN2710549.1 sigma-70 family RNA polymerase sigma factor [Calditrichaceae bacterium]
MLTDKDAILACQSGNTEAFRHLVEKYKTRAYYSALLLTKNSEDALDLSQDAFFRAFRSLNRFDTSKNFYTWFYKILRNLCINHIHRREKIVQMVHDDDGADAFDRLEHEDKNPEEIFEENERSQMLWAGLNKLKETDREIILLKEFDDMSYQEIADALGIPVGSVMSRLFYARKRLLKEVESLNEL